MNYLYEVTQKNYEDYASGKVLYHAPGATSFPVRLASEIIQRCFQLLSNKNVQPPYTLFDPCCGGAYMLTVIGLLHGQNIKNIVAADIDDSMLDLARKNLSLLTTTGMKEREEQLRQWARQYEKPSHAEALQSCVRLSEQVQKLSIEDIHCFQNDITLSSGLRGKNDIHIVMTDLPYGDLVSWQGEGATPLHALFRNLHKGLDPACSVVAVIADKSQKLQHDQFNRLQYFKIGKRHVGIFEVKNQT